MTPIYHIAHLDNVARIVAAEVLHCDSYVTAHNLSVVNIGHQSIKDNRLKWSVPEGPGGVVGDYVPFYFGPRAPMLYAIDKGGVAGYQGGQDSVITLVATAENVEAAGLEFVFADGHAAMAMTDYYVDLSDLTAIDWEVIKGKWWHNTPEDPDRKRRRNAEFLVHGTLPWAFVEKIGVASKAVVPKVEALLANANHAPPIVVKPAWYY